MTFAGHMTKPTLLLLKYKKDKYTISITQYW